MKGKDFMAGHSGGPWGGGGGNRGGGDDDDRGHRGNGDRRPPEGGSQIPEIDELVRKGQDQLRVLMGGRGGRGRGNGAGGDGGGGPGFGRGTIVIGALIAAALWGPQAFIPSNRKSSLSSSFLVSIIRPAIRGSISHHGHSSRPRLSTSRPNGQKISAAAVAVVRRAVTA